MTLFSTSRSRKLILWTAMASVGLFTFFFVHRIVSVHAARHAVTDTDSRFVSEQELAPHPGTTAVLVELFTSEGCSSCPPADALLARLQLQQPVASADIIALEEHVDYWDQLGWHDRFSAHQFTDRQNVYAQRLHLDDIYTPQMVVDGNDQFVGNDGAHALRAIAQAAHTPKLPLTLTNLNSDGNRITGTVSTTTPSPPKADLYAVVVEPAASTNVLHGENGGHKLQHVSVVRSMQRIGKLESLPQTPLSFTLNIPKDAAGEKLRVVIFVQRNDQGPVLGAVSGSVGAGSGPIAQPASLQIASR
jgi:hypothetical protein